MLVAFVACLVGLVVVLVALAQDEPLAAAVTDRAQGAPVPGTPAVAPLPPPPAAAPLGRGDFPLAWPGYDPAVVDGHLDQLAKTWEEVLAFAPPEIIERAKRLEAMRDGRPAEPVRREPPVTPVRAPAERERLPSTLGGEELDPHAEALRTHAALELLTVVRRTR